MKMERAGSYETVPTYNTKPGRNGHYKLPWGHTNKTVFNKIFCTEMVKGYDNDNKD
jgi:hypothetical protein